MDPNIGKRSFKHGAKTRTFTSPEYNSWSNMKRRCLNPNHPRWKDWGGRGITVCERWLNFSNFLEDMGPKPQGTTLNRIDNEGNYEPENCEWADAVKQNMNKRSTKLTPEMITKIKELRATGLTMTEVGKELNLGRHTVSKALFAP